MRLSPTCETQNAPHPTSTQKKIPQLPCSISHFHSSSNYDHHNIIIIIIIIIIIVIIFDLLAWVRWGFSDSFSPCQPILSQSWLQSQLKLPLNRWFHVLHDLPFPLWLPTSINFVVIDWVFFIQSLAWCKTSVILAIHSLFHNSSDDVLSLRLTWHVHRAICMSARAVLLTSLSFSGQILLPYSMVTSDTSWM